ncbi:unnamed protein product [Bursaphelenchus okinawaensis]|uniref:DnaK protein n=1 Tax=Bursaphelenchus okinawaensis TaxID=465554 RepID=A0A811JWD7_9BILA|nr:unnamed protein product [Bursaphelenchus okinawaensis]CAG9085623.1 unnamed protein product [Bursaphelenchus okinawaensis]
MSYVIGIDLGLSSSSVAIYCDGKVKTLSNIFGNFTTPSCVAFNNSDCLVGEAAVGQATRNPANTLFNAKRLIGRFFNEVRDEVKSWPYRVVDIGNGFCYQVEYKGEVTFYTPEQITATILSELKAIAEYFCHTVKDAVITVPAHFKQPQVLATVEAAKMAGLNVLRIINEPTATAIAYTYNRSWADYSSSSTAHSNPAGYGNPSTDHNSPQTFKNMLIYDLEEDTFDASVITVKDLILDDARSQEMGQQLYVQLSNKTRTKQYELKATSGNGHLGTNDFVTRLMDYLIDEFQTKYNKDLSFEIESLFDGEDFYTTISRVRFESLIVDLLNDTLEAVKYVLNASKLLKRDIHEVLLVGTQMPMVKQLIFKFFAGHLYTFDTNLEQAVAHGAAIQAAVLSAKHEHRLPDIRIFDQANAPVVGVGVLVEPDHTNILCQVKQSGFKNTPVRPFSITLNIDHYGMLTTRAVVHITGSETNVTVTNVNANEYDVCSKKMDHFRRLKGLEERAKKMNRQSKLVVDKCSTAISDLASCPRRVTEGEVAKLEAQLNQAFLAEAEAKKKVRFSHSEAES